MGLTEKARRARDDWLKSKRGKLVLKAAGIAVGATAAALTIFTGPATPVALAIGGLSLASGTVIPDVEWLLDWRDGKETM